MIRDDDNHANKDNGFAHGFGADLPGNNQRQEPTFGGFDEDDAYEESDRDADYTSGYHPDDADPEEDFDDDFPEENESDEDESDLFQDEESDTPYDPGSSDEDDPDSWQEDEDYSDEQENRGQNWPLGLIAVAVVALVLLAAGGYGVMQQRAATEEELRELRATLATLSTPRDGGSGLAAAEELQLAYDKLATETEALRLENKTLTDTIAGLETQLGSQQQAKSTAVPAAAVPAKLTQADTGPAEPARAEPAHGTVAKITAPSIQPIQPVTTRSAAPAPTSSKPTAAQSAAGASAGPWFVNFGSYATRNMAESWAARLKPGTGKVTIMPNTSNGRTLYRLRVVGLTDSASAKQVARKLETELRVSELWVGKE